MEDYNTRRKLESVNKIEHEDYCIKYPEDKNMMINKMIGLFVVASIFLYLAYDYFNNKIDMTLFSLSLLGVGLLYGISASIHRLVSYDEICVEGNYFIVKKKNKVINYTPIKDINIVSITSPFDMFHVASKRLYFEDTLLFHYRTSEISKEDEEKLMKSMEKGNLNGK